MAEYLCMNCKWEIGVKYIDGVPRCSDCDSEIEGHENYPIKMTSEDYQLIRLRVETERKQPFRTWATSQLIEGDVPALLDEIELLNDELADREKSHISIYCENKELEEEISKLRSRIAVYENL